MKFFYSFLLSLLFIPIFVFAQTPDQNLEFAGIAISPFLIEATLEPGVSSNYTITLQNTTREKLSFDISINDFVSEEKSAQARFLPTGENSNPKFSLSSWIAILVQPNFTLSPGAETKIEFSITPPKDP